MKNLSNILRDNDDLVPERELTSQQTAELHDVVEACRNTLKQLEETVKKYHELDSSPTSLGSKAREAWKRLKWEPEDIKELRIRIIANVTLFSAFHDRIAK